MRISGYFIPLLYLVFSSYDSYSQAQINSFEQESSLSNVKVTQGVDISRSTDFPALGAYSCKAVFPDEGGTVYLNHINTFFSRNVENSGLNYNEVLLYFIWTNEVDEGGYEAVGSMKGYEKPSQLSHDVEEKIINSVYDLLPESWDKEDIAIGKGSDGKIILDAIRGKGIGPTIDFMPEWGAFGWFRSDDQVEWEITVDKSGMYSVEMEWSVSDQEAGKPFILIVEGNELRGEVGKTGSWETFATKSIGQIMLQEGKQTVVFKPASTFGNEHALLDMRKITFTPNSRKYH